MVWRTGATIPATTVGQTVATLPAGYRPPKEIRVYTMGQYASGNFENGIISVSPSGEVASGWLTRPHEGGEDEHDAHERLPSIRHLDKLDAVHVTPPPRRRSAKPRGPEASPGVVMAGPEWVAPVYGVRTIIRGGSVDFFEEAISGRKVINFTYGGHFRVVQPGALGNHVSTGKLLLRGYQIDGASSSRFPPFWTLFEVDRIVDPADTGDVFIEEPPDYRLGDKHLGTIIAEL